MTTANLLLDLAIKRVEARLAQNSVGVQPGFVSSVVQYLEDDGYVLVPKTIIGASGWMPTELWAYQAGVMHERYEQRERIAQGVGLADNP